MINGSERNADRIEQKKFGYFQDDCEYIRSIFRTIGMREYDDGAFKRHPLAYLVEAADDICYAIVDLEDSVDQGLIDKDMAVGLLLPLAKAARSDINLNDHQGKSQLRWLRAMAIGGLIKECMIACECNLDDLRTGDMSKSLVKQCSLSTEYSKVKEVVKIHAYNNRRVLQVELVGYKVIATLLDMFIESLRSPDLSHSRKHLAFMSHSYLKAQSGDGISILRAIEKLDDYQRVLAGTDFVSGMTDTFAIDMFRKFSGIALPD